MGLGLVEAVVAARIEAAGRDVDARAVRVPHATEARGVDRRLRLLDRARVVDGLASAGVVPCGEDARGLVEGVDVALGVEPDGGTVDREPLPARVEAPPGRRLDGAVDGNAPGLDPARRLLARAQAQVAQGAVEAPGAEPLGVEDVAGSRR